MNMRSSAQYDVAGALERAEIQFKRSGGRLRIKAAWRGGNGWNVAIHPDGGCWTDHGNNGESGNWHMLCDRLGISGPARALPVPVKKFSANKPAQDAADVSRRRRQALDAWEAGLEDLSGWARDYLISRGGTGGDGLLESARAAGARVLPASHWAAKRDGQGASCLLWPMRDPRTGELVGVQREWGRGHDNKRMKGLHMVPINKKNPDVKHTAALRFPGGYGDDLYICEGQISGAAVYAATGATVLAMFDTSGLAAVPRVTIERAILGGVNRIIVAGDSGAPGVAAGEKCIARLRTWGLRAEICWTVPPAIPENSNPDWADCYEAGGPDLVGRALKHGVRALPELPELPDASIRSLRPWRHAPDNADQPAWPEAQPVEQARVVLRDGIRKMVQEYCAFLKEKKDIKPWLFATTTGTGKSTLLRDLINDPRLLMDGGSCLALVPDHAQASTYEKAGWRHYRGRNPDPDSPGYCPNYVEMMKAVEARHIPQNSFCHRCPNGLKWSIGHHGSDSKNGAAALDLLHSLGYCDEQIASLTACVWQDHLRETREARFVVACTPSYSETLATWPTVRNGKHLDVDRLVVVDEGIAMSEPVQVGMPDLDIWAKRASDRVKGLRQAIIDEPAGPTRGIRIKKLEKLITALEAAIPIFPALSGELAKWVGKAGKLTVSPELAGHIQAIVSAADKAETAEWERLEFGRDGSLIKAPLRAAHAIAETLRYGDGHVAEGKISISATKPILDRLGKKPAAFFDATPDPVTRAAVRAADGYEVQAIARQNVRIIRHPQKFWGLTAWKRGSDTDWREREKERYQALRKLYPEAAMLVHCKVHDALDPDRRDPLMGHWGAQHRAHDEWTGKDLVLVGGFYPPMNAWRQQYQAARIAALAAKATPADWPEWPDDMAMQDGEWIDESGTEVQSRHPMPADPRIRAWLLDIIGAETAQAIGRARGANLAEPVTVRIFGGWPLANIGQYGLWIDGYEQDPADLGSSRSGTALDARQMIAGAVNAGERTIRRIQAWVRERTDRAVGIDRVRGVLREIEAIARRAGKSIEMVAEVVAATADAYLNAHSQDWEKAIIESAKARHTVTSMLLDLAYQSKEPAGPTETIERTGPPAAIA